MKQTKLKFVCKTGVKWNGGMKPTTLRSCTATPFLGRVYPERWHDIGSSSIGSSTWRDFQCSCQAAESYHKTSGKMSASLFTAVGKQQNQKIWDICRRCLPKLNLKRWFTIRWTLWKFFPWKWKACSNRTTSSTVQSLGTGVKFGRSATARSTLWLCQKSSPRA